MRYCFSEGVGYNNIHSSLRYIEYNLIFDLEDTAGYFFEPQIVYIHVKMLINGFHLYNTLYSSFIDFLYQNRVPGLFVVIAIILVIKVIFVHYRKSGKESKI